MGKGQSSKKVASEQELTVSFIDASATTKVLICGSIGAARSVGTRLPAAVELMRRTRQAGQILEQMSRDDDDLANAIDEIRAGRVSDWEEPLNLEKALWAVALWAGVNGKKVGRVICWTDSAMSGGGAPERALKELGASEVWVVWGDSGAQMSMLNAVFGVEQGKKEFAKRKRDMANRPDFMRLGSKLKVLGLSEMDHEIGGLQARLAATEIRANLASESKLNKKRARL